MSQENTEQEGALSSKRRTVSLKHLYLDPNNFRFIDNDDYKSVAEDHWFDAEVQRRTTRFILGHSAENVPDLIASMKENGWLEVDPILVRHTSPARYLIVEGNRRIATLKYLQRRHEEDAIDLGRLDPSIFNAVPVVLYDNADERHHLLMMGLHHITGKRRWPALNRALAMKRLTEEFAGDSDAVCRALGVSRREYNLSIRTVALVNAYRDSDYGDQFVTEQFNLFREVLKSPAIREWLQWDQQTAQARHSQNLERLFSWMSREPEPDAPADEDDTESPLRATGEAVITTGGHVRELAKIIGDPAAVKRLEETRSLQDATLSSDLLVKNEVEGALESCDRDINRLSVRAAQLAQSDLDRVELLIGKLQGIALARKRQPLIRGQSRPWQPFNELTRERFGSVSVHEYRGLADLHIEQPGRINMLVGLNNAGKTSLLEAIYLLVCQSDERALLDITQWRYRSEDAMDPAWLVEQLPRRARITGAFDAITDSEAALTIETTLEPDAVTEDDQTGFLGHLSLESRYSGRTQSTEVTFFDGRPRRTNFAGTRHWLCRAIFTSPFTAGRPSVLARCNRDSLEAGTKERIIEFIRTRIDPGISNIELADRYERFLVSHAAFERAPDLGSFGDGLRRIFEIGLLFAGARGGVVLIDEFENALHTGLLRDFTRFVQELAVECDVQVFLATHSKETIDAFLLNEYRLDDLVGFALLRDGTGNRVRRYAGAQLLKLHEAVDFDLRGVR